MCLGIPGKITEIYEVEGLKMGQLDFSGVTRETCLEYVPEAKVGQYALVHVGFAINVLEEDEAQETLALIREVIAFSETEEPEVA